MTEPTLTATSGGAALLAPLLAQYDTSLAMLLARLDGLDDDEYRWSPIPGTADLVDDGRGGLVAAADEGGEPMRTIAWTLAHLSDCFAKRADHTDGSHSLPMSYDPFPSDATGAIEELQRRAAQWRRAVSGADEQQAVQVGYSAYPAGMDRDLPFVDIVWWNNRELIHHGADIAMMRDLYAALGG